MGQDIISLCVLMVLIVSVLINRQKIRLRELLLCCLILLAGALIVGILGSFFGNDDTQVLVISVVQVILTLASFILLLCYSFSGIRNKTGAAFLLPLFFITLPMILAIIIFVSDGEIAVFSSAAMISVLISFIVGQQAEDTTAEKETPEDETAEEENIEESMEKLEKVRMDADALLLGHPIPFRWEMENIEHYAALSSQNKTGGVEVIFDLRVADFRLPPLCIRRMIDLIARLRSGESEEIHPIFVITERQDDNIRVIIENAEPGISKETDPKELEWIDYELGEENKRLRFQCGGSVRRLSNDSRMSFVILVPGGE